MSEVGQMEILEIEPEEIESDLGQMGILDIDESDDEFQDENIEDEEEGIITTDVKFSGISGKKIKEIKKRQAKRAIRIWDIVPSYRDVQLVTLPKIREYPPDKPVRSKKSILGEINLGEIKEIETSSQKAGTLTQKDRDIIISQFEIERVIPRKFTKQTIRPSERYYNMTELKAFTRAAGLTVSTDYKILSSNLLEWYRSIEPN